MKRLAALLMVSACIAPFCFFFDRFDNYRGTILAVSIVALFIALIDPHHTIEGILKSIGIESEEDGKAWREFIGNLFVTAVIVGIPFSIAQKLDPSLVWPVFVATSILYMHLNYIHMKINKIETNLEIILKQIIDKEEQEEA